MIWEESEKFFKNAPDNPEIFKKFKEMKLKQSSMSKINQQKIDTAKQEVIETVYNSIGIMKGVNTF